MRLRRVWITWCEVNLGWPLPDLPCNEFVLSLYYIFFCICIYLCTLLFNTISYDFKCRLTVHRQVSKLGKELLTFPENLNSPLVVVGLCGCHFLPLMSSGYPPFGIAKRLLPSLRRSTIHMCEIHQTSSNCEKSK